MMKGQSLSGGRSLVCWEAVALLHLVAAIFLAGCAGVPFAPEPVAHVRVLTESSESIAVEPPWFVHVGSELYLTGYVRRQIGSGDASGTRLWIVITDHQGVEIRREVIPFDFSPLEEGHSLRRGSVRTRHHHHGSYRVRIDPPCEEIATIRIIAVDAEQ